MNENSTTCDDAVQGRLSKELDALKAWTGRDNTTLVFDTDRDAWDHGKFNDVLRRPSNAVIGITDKGDVFGGYVSVAVNETGKWLPDDGQFAFSFFSHGRCNVPQRWVLRKDRKNEGCEVMVCDTTKSLFIDFGSDGFFKFHNGWKETYVFDPSCVFEGLGDDVLTGERDDFFTTARLLVVHLD